MEKIAIVSDIHGNLPALEAVVADANVRGCTAFINLGDIVSGPLWPRETAAFLMAQDWPTIAGNHERQLLASDPAKMGASDLFARQALSPTQLEWLASLPPTLQWRHDVYFCHANPHDDLHYLLHRVEPDQVRDASSAEIAAMIGDAGTHVVGCGHTHLPRQVKLDDGRIIFNPGSVGLPAYDWDYPHFHVMEEGSPQARYAILSGENEDRMVELIGVDYDYEAAATRAEANGRMDWAGPLRTGKALRN